MKTFDLSEHYTVVLDELGQIGKHYFAGGQMDQSVKVLASGCELASAPDAPAVPRLQLLISYGFSLTWQASLVTGAYDQPVAVLKQAVEQLQTLDRPGMLASALDGLGFSYYHQALGSATGDFSKAHDYFERALALREAQADPLGLCQSRLHLGLIAERERRFQEAETIFANVYQLSGDYGFDSEQAEAARHLGFAHLRANNLDLALRSFQEALALTKKSPGRLWLPFAYLSIGEILQRQGEYDLAEQHYQSAYELAQAMQIRRAAAQILYSLGELAEAQLHPAQAREHFEAAYQIAEEIGFVLGQRTIAAKLGRLAPPSSAI